MVNLLNNVPIAAIGETRNPYREWIGALIRADVYGWALPDRPGTAARLVFQDASLSHRNNGIYAAMWAAALVSVACVASSVTEAIERSLDYVPARSRLAEALGFVNELYRTSHTWEQALERIRSRFGQYSWVHSINNACLITAGLLWGTRRFRRDGRLDGAGWLGYRLQRCDGWIGRRHCARRNEAASAFHQPAARSHAFGRLRL